MLAYWQWTWSVFYLEKLKHRIEIWHIWLHSWFEDEINISPYKTNEVGSIQTVRHICSKTDITKQSLYKIYKKTFLYNNLALRKVPMNSFGYFSHWDISFKKFRGSSLVYSRKNGTSVKLEVTHFLSLWVEAPLTHSSMHQTVFGTYRWRYFGKINRL